MITFFDALTVACFIGLVIAFFQFSEGDTPTLLRFLVAGVALAIANQLGNRGFVVLGIILVIAALGFGWMCLSRPKSER
jgi:uncharacterized membrane protein YccC